MRSRKLIKYEYGDSRRSKKLEGRYANFFKIGNNAFEFLLDFEQYYPENGEEQFTGIVISPVYAKAFLKTLKKSVERCDKIFKVLNEKYL